MVLSRPKVYPPLPTQFELANARAMEADRSCVSLETTNDQQQLHISQLELELSGIKGRESEAAGLKDQIIDLDEQLSRLHTEVSDCHMTR